MVDYAKKLLKGAGIIFIVGIISSLLSYGIRITLARKLTVEEFGLFFAIYNVILLIGWLKGFGLTSAIGKFIPGLNSKQDQGGIKSIIVLVGIFTLLSNLLFLALIYFFPTNLITSYFKSGDAKPVLLALFIYVFFEGFTSLFSSYFLAISRYFLHSTRDLIMRIVVLLLLLVWTDVTILNAAIIYALASVINLLFHGYFFLRLFRYFLYPIKITKEMRQELFSFSYPLLIRDFFGVLMARVDNLTLLFFRPLREIGIYNAILPTVDTLLLFSRPFGRIMFPLSAELHSLNEKKKIGSLLRMIHKHLLLITVPLILVIFSFSQFILNTFFGTEYGEGFVGLNILAIGFLFTSLNLVSYSVLLGVGKHKQAAVVTIFCNILNFLLDLMLIPYFGQFSQGYIGTILGTVISTIVLFYLSGYYLQKSIDYHFPMRDMIFLVLISSFLILMGYFIKRNVDWIYGELGLFMGAIVVVYPVLVFLFKITTFAELKTIFKMLTTKEKKMKDEQN